METLKAISNKISQVMSRFAYFRVDYMIFIEHHYGDEFRAIYLKDGSDATIIGKGLLSDVCKHVIACYGKNVYIAFVMKGDKSIMRSSHIVNGTKPPCFKDLQLPKEFSVHTDFQGHVFCLNKCYVDENIVLIKREGLVVTYVISKHQIAKQYSTASAALGLGEYTFLCSERDQTALHGDKKGSLSGYSSNCGGFALEERLYTWFGHQFFLKTRITSIMSDANLIHSVSGKEIQHNVAVSFIKNGMLSVIKTCGPLLVGYMILLMPYHLYKQHNLSSRVSGLLPKSMRYMNMEHAVAKVKNDSKVLSLVYGQEGHNKAISYLIEKLIQADGVIAKITGFTGNFSVKEMKISLRKFPTEKNVNLNILYKFTFKVSGLSAEHTKTLFDVLNRDKKITSGIQLKSLGQGLIEFFGDVKN